MNEYPFKDCVKFQNDLIMKLKLHRDAVLAITEQPYLNSCGQYQTGQIIKIGSNVPDSWNNKIITFANKDAAIFGIDNVWDLPFNGKLNGAIMQLLYATVLKDNILGYMDAEYFEEAFATQKELQRKMARDSGIEPEF